MTEKEKMPARARDLSYRVATNPISASRTRTTSAQNNRWLAGSTADGSVAVAGVDAGSETATGSLVGGSVAVGAVTGTPGCSAACRRAQR